MSQESIDFDGADFDRQSDGERLRTQLDHIKLHLLKHDGWHTLFDLRRALGYSEASISAQLRNLRKKKFGGYEVARRRIADSGTWEYHLGLKLTP